MEEESKDDRQEEMKRRWRWIPQAKKVNLAEKDRSLVEEATDGFDEVGEAVAIEPVSVFVGSRRFHQIHPKRKMGVDPTIASQPRPRIRI